LHEYFKIENRSCRILAESNFRESPGKISLNDYMRENTCQRLEPLTVRELAATLMATGLTL
jgi:hypothetical protein